jgi:uncharacterized protein YndB with AHSA1/START domain
MSESTFIYVTYIRTTPQEFWSALTDPAFTEQYWFGMTVQSDWKAGSSWQLSFPDGRVADAGEIVEAVAHRRMVIKWRNEFKPEKVEGYSRCTMDLERRRRRQAHNHSQPRASRFYVHRGGLRRLAAHLVQPQIAT